MEDSNITVIITVWKRAYLNAQLDSLVNQTVLPESIWIIHNEDFIDISQVVAYHRRLFPKIFVIDSDLNLKYFGRFSLCANVETGYTLIIDDDVIPSSQWLEICLETSKEYGAVVCCTGRIIRPNNYRPEEISEHNKGVQDYFVGDSAADKTHNFTEEATLVDYGCNSYFFKTSWIRYFWEVWPITFDSGEDIHLSASLMILQSIPTIVPSQTSPDNTGNLEKKYSADEFSSWLKDDFIDIRQTVFEYLIKERKWKPLLWKSTNLHSYVTTKSKDSVE